MQHQVPTFSFVLGNAQTPLNAGTYAWPYLQEKAFHSPSLCLTRPALPWLLLQSQAVSALTAKEARSTLHVMHFSLRKLSIKLWEHIRTFFQWLQLLFLRFHVGIHIHGKLWKCILTFLWTSLISSAEMERSAKIHSLPLSLSDSRKKTRLRLVTCCLHPEIPSQT